MKFSNTLYQGIKFLLVGAFATFCDLIFFNAFILILAGTPLIAKGLSFLIATAIKYGGNKCWTFQTYNKGKVKKELVEFSVVTLVALVIDLAVFHYATNVMGPQFGMMADSWRQVSVVLAALSSALLSFVGYKFLVFKKDGN